MKTSKARNMLTVEENNLWTVCYCAAVAETTSISSPRHNRIILNAQYVFFAAGRWREYNIFFYLYHRSFMMKKSKTNSKVWQSKLNLFFIHSRFIPLNILYLYPTKIPGGVVSAARVIVPYTDILHVAKIRRGGHKEIHHTSGRKFLK